MVTGNRLTNLQLYLKSLAEHKEGGGRTTPKKTKLEHPEAPTLFDEP